MHSALPGCSPGGLQSLSLTSKGSWLHLGGKVAKPLVSPLTPISPRGQVLKKFQTRNWRDEQIWQLVSARSWESCEDSSKKGVKLINLNRKVRLSSHGMSVVGDLCSADNWKSDTSECDPTKLNHIVADGRWEWQRVWCTPLPACYMSLVNYS